MPALPFQARTMLALSSKCKTDATMIAPSVSRGSPVARRVHSHPTPSSLNLLVWERGAGLTRACGTGACATAVAAIRSKRVASPVTVTLPGGDLTITWAPGETIRMTGPATHVFTGETDWDTFGL